MVLPGEGGKDVFHGSSKLSNTMPPPPPPPKENFESCTVAYCCHKKAMLREDVRLVTSLGPQGGRLHASDTALRDIRLIYPNPATLLRQLYVVGQQNIFDHKHLA